MGFKWSVIVNADLGEGIRKFTQYEGQSLFQAIKHMREARRMGIAYISLIWRPI